ncbi:MULTISPECIES: HAD-IB family hydrolase [unclassified Frondihabitans]|uniref:HAD-IB family hydrolase n=1 Tax=unclassified Frondihabitans TaxID=2626248 RepID=UPI000F4E8CAA|nr:MULTISPECIES: HAD-IB family hydrolase [unclassified Frondihabitans]RPE78313.1 HAD superfamily hydrolase (TIGR01490 family) [Frondihabitans sp. PhB153]RPF08594.1 HAD superfamily hydrolase (TIGR01490 family) [Frondihabitans sp. PhB161]
MSALDFPDFSTDLGSSHVFLTGGTGFVGQAILERLLASHPGTRITLLIRTKGSTSGVDRLRHVLRKPVFASWRESVGPDGVEDAILNRLNVLEGGLDAVPELPGDLDVVIHSASSVSFDPPIDQAFETNVGGAVGLYEALIASGTDPHVVHVSTAYVGGLRKGIFPEASLTHEVDWRTEFEAARAARSRVELSSRQPEVLRRFIAEARAKHGKEGPLAVSREAEERRVAWVKAKLVDHGRARAESLGWTDVYTLTKAFAERAAEQMWAARGHRLSFVRPAIVESALRHPHPGWIDGFKVADPLIMAYGRGMLPEFPGVPDSVLDVVPVDFVVNVIVLVASNPAAAGEPQFFHVSSGASNPLPIHRMFTNLSMFFTANPVPTADSGSIAAATWRFPGGRKVERAVRLQARLNDARESVFLRLPSTDRTREALAGVDRRRADLESLQSLTDLYRHYIQSEIIFDDRRTKALQAALVATQPAEVSGDIGFDMADIQWEDYFQTVHFPAVTTMTRAFSVRPASSGPALDRELPRRKDVVAIFDLEGTVVDSNIVEQYLWVRGSGFGKAAWPAEVASLLASLPGYLRAEQRDRGEFIRAFLRRYEGMPVTRLEEVVARGYAQTLLKHTMPEALERIAAHRAAGHRTVLVTGSIGTLVSPLAHLFDEVVAGTMHARDGIYTGYLAQPPVVDEARAAWLRQYAERNSVDLSASYGYGDSHADLVWLEMLGNPSAVNPDSNLSREALRRKWRIRDWKRGPIQLTSSHLRSAGETPAGGTD